MVEGELYNIIRERFEYKNGELIFVKPPHNHSQLRGKSAGCVRAPKGYIYIKINGKSYTRARLVYLYHHGVFPRPVCDHINRNRADDRIENLRPVTVAQNNQNHSRYGVKKMPNGKYQARIAQVHIGTFNTLDEAKAAYYKRRSEIWQN